MGIADASTTCPNIFNRFSITYTKMSFTRKDVLASRNSSSQVLLLISIAMVVVSYAIQTTEAAPGFGSNDRRIYPNWDRRFDHRIRLAKKNFEDDIIARPETRARFSDEEDQAEIDRAIQTLLQKYLVSKGDVSKRDYIRLM